MINQNFIQKHLYHRSLISYLLFPLSLIYAIILIIRRLIYFSFPFLKYQSTIPLLCIGNISSGGTGKTPFTIFLVKLLQKMGYKIAIITRGYKGDFENNNTLISDFNNVFDCAKNAGDEAYLMSQALPNTPIIAGRNRIQSIKMLESQFPHLDYIVLDDAYQYLKLVYKKNFILFNGVSPLGNGFTLPAGILREPLINAFYADFFVYNGYSEIPVSLNSFRIPILKVNYKITSFVNKDNVTLNINELKNKNLALMSAIGIPKSFELTVKNAGLDFQEHFIYPDHYNFDNLTELDILNNQLKAKNIDYLLITEKDQAKLTHIKHSLPVIIVKTEFDMEDASRLFLESKFNYKVYF